MKRLFLTALCSLAILGLPSCTNTSTVTLDYVPVPGAVVRGAPEFSVGAFANKRGVPSHILGRVRLPVGMPVDTIQTAVPVETVVANAFAHALHE